MVNIRFMFASTALALSASTILSLLNSVYAFLTAACFVSFVGGVFWKRGNAQGAVTASIVGVATVLISWTDVAFPP